MSDLEHEYVRLLKFDSDNAEFARGFEAGFVWSILEDMADDQEWCHTVHASNAEMMMRMADACMIEFVGKDVSDEWIHIHFHATQPTSLRERLDS